MTSFRILRLNTKSLPHRQRTDFYPSFFMSFLCVCLSVSTREAHTADVFDMAAIHDANTLETQILQSWSLESRNARSACRVRSDADYRLYNIGFRLVRELD
jgi:hypothetical protein